MTNPHCPTLLFLAQIEPTKAQRYRFLSRFASLLAAGESLARLVRVSGE